MTIGFTLKILPKKEKVDFKPYSFNDNLVGVTIVNKGSGIKSMILSQDGCGVTVFEDKSIHLISYDHLLLHYKSTNGSALGYIKAKISDDDC